MNEDILHKFPKIFRQALEKGIVSLPDDTMDNYEPLKAYRALSVVKGEPPKITNEAFASQIELKHLYPDKRCFKDYSDDNVSNYSCSLYSDINVLNNVMHLPRQSKAIICGTVKAKNGVINYDHQSTHINWWLFENHKAVEDFKVIENDKE